MAYGEAQDSWAARVAAAWGHLAPEVLCATIVALIIVGLRPPAPSQAVIVAVLLMALVVASWVFMRRHDRRLCELCVAALPLNAAERAVRYGRRFRMSHSGAEPRLLVPYLAVLIGSSFLPGTWGRVVWAGVQCSMIYLIMSHVTHRRFQPWCPWCNGGGGGTERDHDASPPPLPDNDRQLV